MKLFEQGNFVEEQRRIRKEIEERWFGKPNTSIEKRWFGKSNTTEEVKSSKSITDLYDSMARKDK